MKENINKNSKEQYMKTYICSNLLLVGDSQSDQKEGAEEPHGGS